jgi:molybdopterin synthase sulfur carrier subunit
LGFGGLTEDAIGCELLKIHLYTEQGHVREHVLLYYNDDNIAWLSDLDQIWIQPGDKLRVLQAVSGG